MSNIIDYVSWRGDLDFTASPFNEVDSHSLYIWIFAESCREYIPDHRLH